MDHPQILYSLVSKEELPSAIEIEQTGFIPEEAATLETFEYRQNNAPELFLGAYIQQNPPSAGTGNPLNTRKLIGYVAATVASTDTLTKESMKDHVPVSQGGISVCIHSVCVHPEWKRKGIGHGLLKEYVRRLEADGDERLQRVLLICHDQFIDFYKGAGFLLVGKSPVVHGPVEFYEMKRELRHQSDPSLSATAPPPEMSPDILAALKKPSASPGAIVRRFADFTSIQDLVTSDASTGAQFNKYKLVCPRTACGSLILLKGVGKLVETSSVQLDSPSDPPPPSLLPSLPPPPDTIECWLVTPDPMQFENIGFSRAVAGAEVSMKLLSCAECDLGPLGWHQVESKEFWLVCSRVSYKE